MDLHLPAQYSCKCSLHPQTHLLNTSCTPPYAQSAWHHTCTRCSTSGLHPLFDIGSKQTLSSRHHKQGMRDRCGAHTMCGQDWLQSIKPPEMMLLLPPLPVTHTDHRQEGPYFCICMLLFLIGFSYIASPPRSLFVADAHARRWIYSSMLVYIVDMSWASSRCG